MDSEERDKRMKLSAKKYITYPLRGYVSEAAITKIKMVVAAGIDPDLAFTLVESAMPETEFYDIEREEE